MTGNEDTRRPARRMPGAYRHFLGVRRPSAIFSDERAQPEPPAAGESDAQARETGREPG